MKKNIIQKKKKKLLWLMSAKSDKNTFYSKRQKKHKITMVHECQI